ncbi:MAG: hypothetical protein EOO88_20865 [Pedobacter sp.]|nr:MAG: hypothetical protein EOO88_20865 [Pedobacter sp.]
MQQPTVSSIIFRARDKEQLKQNPGTVGWNLTPYQVKRLDEASTAPVIYPYWH